MKQKYLTTVMVMKKRILQNAHPVGIRAGGVIPDRYFTANAAINSYREATKNYVINVSKKGPQGMSIVQFAKYRKTTLKTLVLAKFWYGLMPRHGKKLKS